MICKDLDTGSKRMQEEDGGKEEQWLQLDGSGSIFSHGPSLKYLPPGSDSREGAGGGPC